MRSAGFASAPATRTPEAVEVELISELFPPHVFAVSQTVSRTPNPRVARKAQRELAAEVHVVDRTLNFRFHREKLSLCALSCYMPTRLIIACRQKKTRRAQAFRATRGRLGVRGRNWRSAKVFVYL